MTHPLMVPKRGEDVPFGGSNEEYPSASVLSSKMDSSKACTVSLSQIVFKLERL